MVIELSCVGLRNVQTFIAQFFEFVTQGSGADPQSICSLEARLLRFDGTQNSLHLLRPDNPAELLTERRGIGRLLVLVPARLLL